MSNLLVIDSLQCKMCGRFKLNDSDWLMADFTGPSGFHVYDLKAHMLGDRVVPICGGQCSHRALDAHLTAKKNRTDVLEAISAWQEHSAKSGRPVISI